MGADGGVAWVIVREPYRENVEKLRKLLPWHLLSFDKRDENYEFEAPENSLTSTYGTSQDWDILDLQDILDELAELEEEKEDWTLQDFLENAYTDSSDYRMGFTRRISKLEELLLTTYLSWYIVQPLWGEPREHLYDWSKLEEVIERYHLDPALLEMKAKDWEQQIRECIYERSFGSEETWT